MFSLLLQEIKSWRWSWLKGKVKHTPNTAVPFKEQLTTKIRLHLRPSHHLSHLITYVTSPSFSFPPSLPPFLLPLTFTSPSPPTFPPPSLSSLHPTLSLPPSLPLPFLLRSSSTRCVRLAMPGGMRFRSFSLIVSLRRFVKQNSFWEGRRKRSNVNGFTGG